jgi:hypothetical protein
MLVRMLVGLSGSAFSLGPGDECDFPQDEALRLISAGFATPVAEIKIERAVQAPVFEKRGKRKAVAGG